MNRSRWQVLVAVAGAVLLVAGCSGPIYDEGPNNPPNTVFLDEYGSPPNPPEDGVVEDSRVTFYFTGTDILDGDSMVAFYYRLTPPLSPADTGWTRKDGQGLQHVTLTGLRDTTYEFCVYAEDIRGAVDPTPTCRHFRVDVFHGGQIIVDPWVTREGDYQFSWRVEGSEIPPEQMQIEIQLARAYYDSLQSQWEWPNEWVGERTLTTDTQILITDPDTTLLYSIGVWAQDHQGHVLAPVRSCISQRLGLGNCP
jgi:hypothetical protein